MDHRKLIIRPPLAVTAYMYAFGFVWLGIVGSLVVGSLFHEAFSGPFGRSRRRGHLHQLTTWLHG